MTVEALPLRPGSPDRWSTNWRTVLELISLGLPNTNIPARLGISEHTVKFHVASVPAKHGAASPTEAVRLGARRGLIVL